MLQNGHKHGVKLEVVKLPEGSLHSSSQVSEIVGPLRVKPVQTRAIQTVEHILRTAALLLADVGVDQFNTNLLAERADVRVRTVYRYFVDKHAVILCLAERMYQRADESFTRTLRVLADPRVEWRLAIDGAIVECEGPVAALRRALAAPRSRPALVHVGSTDRDPAGRLRRLSADLSAGFADLGVAADSVVATRSAAFLAGGSGLEFTRIPTTSEAELFVVKPGRP